MRLKKRLTATQDLLLFFVENVWVWKNTNTLALENELSAEDKKVGGKLLIMD